MAYLQFKSRKRLDWETMISFASTKRDNSLLHRSRHDVQCNRNDKTQSGASKRFDTEWKIAGLACGKHIPADQKGNSTLARISASAQPHTTMARRISTGTAGRAMGARARIRAMSRVMHPARLPFG
jgi:hypothetical protein